MDPHRPRRSPPPAEPASPEDGQPLESEPEAGIGRDDFDSESQAVEASPNPSDAATVAREELDQVLNAEREKYLRLAAEFDNYRKRTIRERQDAGWRAQSDLVLGLIEVLDDIMRFAHLDPTTVESATVVEGVAMVERKILKSLSGHGLEVINPVDHQFDPAFHEAVGTEPAKSPEDDHVVARVYQPGFVFRGQLLRPARVVVKQWLG